MADILLLKIRIEKGNILVALTVAIKDCFKFRLFGHGSIYSPFQIIPVESNRSHTNYLTSSSSLFPYIGPAFYDVANDVVNTV